MSATISCSGAHCTLTHKEEEEEEGEEEEEENSTKLPLSLLVLLLRLEGSGTDMAKIYMIGTIELFSYSVHQIKTSKKGGLGLLLAFMGQSSCLRKRAMVLH